MWCGKVFIEGAFMRHEKLSVAEIFGWTAPLRTQVAQVKMALQGDVYTPPSRWGLSSVKIYRPVLSVKTWLGWRSADRLVPVTNFFNRTPTSVEDGWSVRKTQVRDFRGGTATYDSHNGTDFAIPPGTLVTAPAAGWVRRVSSEFHRGGLKVVIEHGGGLMTTCGHLGRALVREGEFVQAGQNIALSGYSGIDAVVSFPWNVPHVHFNAWLNGVPVDPFAAPGEVSIWVHHNDPRPFSGEMSVPAYEPVVWDEDALAKLIEGCCDPQLRRALLEIEDLDKRAVDTVFMKNYFPTRFAYDASPYADVFERRPRLVLPFSRDEYDGVRLLECGR